MNGQGPDEGRVLAHGQRLVLQRRLNQIDIGDLLKNPETTPFNRLKYLARQGDEVIVRFFNELFNVVAPAHESGDWTPVERFLNRWEDWLSQHEQIWKPGLKRRWFYYDSTPWTPFTKDPKEARLAILTTGGIYVDGQEPFDAANGDWTFRTIPRDTPRDKFRVAHEHYDLTGVQEDVNCVFPIDRLLEMAREGLIGSVAGTTYTFMGWLPDPMHLIRETAPEVGRRLKANGVDGAVIGTT